IQDQFFSNSIACIDCLMRLLAIALPESDRRGLLTGLMGEQFKEVTYSTVSKNLMLVKEQKPILQIQEKLRIF
ncbi:hypothetical protein, partial [Nostoc sp.]|uniref:hypothetical protein n=1 Tax=Nostoc sp. TaxID=1180 RepID=UPI002FFD1CBD